MVAVTTACASGPEIRKLGDYGTVSPTFTTPQAEKTPTQMTVNLTRPSYVTALFVVPGRGSVIVYPTDSAMDTHLAAGSHTIPVHFAQAAFSRDSQLAALRRGMQGGRRGPPQTVRQDTARAPGDTSRFGLGNSSPGASPIGYLLLVASPSQISYSTLQRRINGITIPIDDDEALSTVMKLVKSAVPDGGSLSGYAKELDRG